MGYNRSNQVAVHLSPSTPTITITPNIVLSIARCVVFSSKTYVLKTFFFRLIGSVGFLNVVPNFPTAAHVSQMCLVILAV